MPPDRFKRRDVLALLAGAAAAPMLPPLPARAQQAMPVIGFLSGAGQPAPLQLTPFRQGLNEVGYVEGRNVAIVVRATDRYEQLAELAAELVRLPAAVIYAFGTANSAQAAKAATATIPIVFANGSDPVSLGLVASMSRPGGNVTGVTFFSGTLGAKRLELLRELLPQAATIAFLVNPTNARTDIDKADMQAAARSVGQQLTVLNASTATEIEAAFAAAAQQRVGAILVNGDAFFTGQSQQQLVALAARHAIPTSHTSRAAAEAGGLMSYGDDRQDSYRQAGVYVGRILKGEKPADLPVLQPAKFELAINLKTARTLGITFPPSFHLRADVVIE
jgi:putative ABC transport system substrate-binding protein